MADTLFSLPIAKDYQGRLFLLGTANSILPQCLMETVSILPIAVIIHSTETLLILTFYKASLVRYINSIMLI